MKCPRQVNYRLDQGYYKVVDMADCIKEECGWLNEAQGRCSIKDIEICLEYISTVLTQLLARMPAARE